MPDVATATEPEQVEIVEDGESQESVAAEVAEAEKVAEAFFPTETVESTEAAATTEAETEAKPADEAEAEVEKKPDETQPHVSPQWVAAAKDVWFTDDEIRAFKDDREAQYHVQARRIQGLQSAGIDPREFMAFRNAQRQPQQPSAQPPVDQAEAQTAPSATTALADFKLEINEDDLAPELVAPLRATEKFVNQLKETLGAENTRLRQEMAGVQGAVQQRAENKIAADNEVRYAAQWDETAKATPDFVAEFGVPSEVKRLPPDDPRVLKIQSFDPYVQAAWRRHAQAMGGDQNVRLQNVVADAFKQYVSDRTTVKASTNGTPTTRTAQPGSVVRQATRRAPTQPKDDGSTENIEAALAESMKAVSDLWDKAGGNPYAMPTG